MLSFLKRRRFILMFGDFVLIVLAINLSGYLRFDVEFNIFDYFTGASFFVIVLYMLMLYVFDLYNVARTARPMQAALRIAVAVMFAGIFSTFLFYLLPDWKFIRGIFLIQMVLVWAGLSGWRWVFAFVLHTALDREDVLIIGAGQGGIALFQMLQEAVSPYRVVGFLDDDPLVESQVRGFSEWLGTVDNLPEVAGQKNIRTVILAVTNKRSSRLFRQLFAMRFKGMTILDMPAVIETLLGRVPVKHIREEWFIFAPGFYMLSRSYVWRLKRILDLSGALVLVLLSLPVMAVTALAIRLESKGPALFKQERVGMGNMVFTIWKFRSMVQHAEAKGAIWAQENDPRVTRVGKFIRKTRIDELPQFFNVLRGEMSLVGPRPERPEFVKDLEMQIPYYRIRHTIRPGITGWAQLNYRYGASVDDARHKLEFDLFYLKAMSVGLDVTILLKTVGVVFFGQGAR
ncbi:MAG: sugar transferase [Deltaproteobacteria bacterium]|nr:sugar transferase [Deltaproteobacteria bacterium]